MIRFLCAFFLLGEGARHMANPVQPYFALTAEKYYKRNVGAFGIAHIYEYVCQRPEDGRTIAVPDGSIDVMLDETVPLPDETCYAAGTVLQATKIINAAGHRYFGVRFQTGVMPCFIDGSPPGSDQRTDQPVSLQQVSLPL